MRRLLAIGFVWLGCAIAWALLGSSLTVRSGGASSSLTDEVYRLWGAPLTIEPPALSFHETKKRKERISSTDNTGRPVETIVEREEDVTTPLSLAGSTLAIHLDLEQRQKGLLWFPTYTTKFDGSYDFVNESGMTRDAIFSVPLSLDQRAYDDLEISSSDGKSLKADIVAGQAQLMRRLADGEHFTVRVRYRTRGIQTFRYALTQPSGEARNVKLTLTTNFSSVDFPAGSLSPTTQTRADKRFEGHWDFSRLVARADVGLELPQRLNPGPLAARITFFAPVGLLFFFFVVAVLSLLAERSLHPLNYFFFGCGFFAFHLLLAYLVDHLPLGISFLIASQVSVALVLSYARLFVGWRFALREIGISQLIYLVLFSVSFFWEGFTGLSIALGAIVTLAVMMQVTGRVDWEKTFTKR